MIILHEPGDILLEAAKLAVYAKRAVLQDVIFVIFTIFWVITRLVLYYAIVLWTTMYAAAEVVSFFPVYFFFNSLLLILGALQIYWTVEIFKIAKNAINAGPGNIEDTRSDDEDDEFSDDSDNKTSSNGHTSGDKSS